MNISIDIKRCAAPVQDRTCKYEAKIGNFCTKHYNEKIRRGEIIKEPENNLDELYEENIKIKDKIIKKCKICLYIFPINKFISLSNGSETDTCFECRNQTKNNLKTIILTELRNKSSCVICGDDDDSHKEFDHINNIDKICEVTILSNKKAIEEEAKKCRILCAKCHRKETNKNVISKDKYVNRNINYIKEYKINIGKCQNNCNDIFDPENLGFYEFDHVDFKNKKAEISDMVYDGLSLKSIEEELKKCVLLCVYCHKKKTVEQNKEKHEYYSNLEQPLFDKTRRKTTEYNIKLETVKEIRDFFNEEKKTMAWISDHLKISYCIIRKILNNVIFFDENYVRKIPERKKYPLMSKEEREQIYYLWWNEIPRKYTAKQIQKKFNCGKSQFEKIVYVKNNIEEQ